MFEWAGRLICVLAEVLGAFGVVIMLVYLAIEARHSRSATESASFDGSNTGLNTLNESLMNDAELAELYFIGMLPPENLDKVKTI
ncbi:MAG: hypothetical protein ACI9BW_001334 [Gammaproteobacteria bacterium]|jgi:hypothetical protein